MCLDDHLTFKRSSIMSGVNNLIPRLPNSRNWEVEWFERLQLSNIKWGMSLFLEFITQVMELPTLETEIN